MIPLMRNYFCCIAVLAAITASACTQQAWYEGIKQSQRQECYKAPPGEREECLKALEGESYDEYRRERQKLMSL